MKYVSWPIVITCFIATVFAYCSESNAQPEKVPTKHLDWGGFTGGYLHEYQRGHITYLIFHKGASVCVVNYTQDSLEYEFMKQTPTPGAGIHSPINPDQWTILPKTK